MENIILKCAKLTRPITADIEAPHYHSDYEFIFVKSGEVRFLVDEKEYEAKAPFVLFLNPFERHRILSAKGNYERTILELNGDNLEQQISPHLVAMLKRRPKNEAPILLLSPETFLKMQDLLDELQRERKEEKAFYETYVLNLLYNLLILVFREAPKLEKPDERMMQVQSYIDEHYSSIESISELAEKFYLSAGHLSRAFKAHTGYTPMEYLLNTRLYKAQALLLDSSLRVNEVSLKVGFADANQFNRQFKKQFLVTPLVFRKMHT